MDARLAAYLMSIGASPDSLDGWTIRTAQRAGTDCAFVITNGPEIHFVSIDERRAMSRKNILEFVAPLIETYGFATTRVPASETNHKLREALGFLPTWQDADFLYWALTELPYQKGNTPCPSL